MLGNWYTVNKSTSLDHHKVQQWVLLCMEPRWQRPLICVAASDWLVDSCLTGLSAQKGYIMTCEN